MTKFRWKEKIVSSCQEAGTYQPFFDGAIETLAMILEQRDKIHKQYVEEGSNPTVVRHTERSGEQNIAKNPLLALESDLNAQALAYWKELGLTMKSWKELKNQINQNVGGLEDLLKGIGNG